MFKKTLVAAAMAGALVGSAFAANVTLYGAVDEGLIYQHTNTHEFDKAGSTSENTFQLNSGIDAGSRFGLKGTEELGNGYAVSFLLENSFDADAGTLGHNGRLFGREASLTLSGPFGKLSAGRMGGVASSAGSYDLVYGIGDAFDGGSSIGLNLYASSRYDNMLTYQTPKFAGVQVTAQYSFQEDTTKNDDGTAKDKGTEGKATANQYAALAVTAEYGNFQGVAAYERELFGNANFGKADDQNTFYLGGNYDFGVAKVFAMGQYFDGARKLGLSEFTFGDAGVADTVSGLDNGLKGYGFHLGTVVPVFGGDATFGLYYLHAKSDTLTDAADTEKVKFNSYGAAARYEYPLSKRTTVYTGVEYYYEKGEAYGDAVDTATYKQDPKASTVGAYVGLMHKF